MCEFSSIFFHLTAINTTRNGFHAGCTASRAVAHQNEEGEKVPMPMPFTHLTIWTCVLSVDGNSFQSCLESRQTDVRQHADALINYGICTSQ